VPSIWERLRERAPDRLKRRIPELRRQRDPEPAPAPEAPPLTEPYPHGFDPEAPPVDVDESSSYAQGPQQAPDPSMPLPEEAAHFEDRELVQWNVGDTIEIDAGAGTAVSALHVGGPPTQPPRPRPEPAPKDGETSDRYEARRAQWTRREEAKRDRWAELEATNPFHPYRQLEPGNADVAAGAVGTVRGIGPASLMVAVSPKDVTINEEAFLPRELSALKRGFDRAGGWVFGLPRDAAVPLKLEHERVWANVKDKKTGPIIREGQKSSSRDIREGPAVTGAGKKEPKTTLDKRVVVISGSPRSAESCAGQDGKTQTLANYAVAALETAGASVDLIDLAVADHENIVRPCKGCVSTAGGYHCHWPCSCWGPGTAAEGVPDVMHDQDIYEKLERADGFLVISPVHWYSVSSQVKAMFDRLVCANLTLSREDADELLENKKDPEETRPAEKAGASDDKLRNWLEGKVGAFLVHGDNGANDYDWGRRQAALEVAVGRLVAGRRCRGAAALPSSIDDDGIEFDGSIVNDPRMAVLPIVAQCRYSGIHVPIALVQGTHVNEGLSYSEGNDQDLAPLETRTRRLVGRLLDTLRGRTPDQPAGEGRP